MNYMNEERFITIYDNLLTILLVILLFISSLIVLNTINKKSEQQGSFFISLKSINIAYLAAVIAGMYLVSFLLTMKKRHWIIYVIPALATNLLIIITILLA